MNAVRGKFEGRCYRCGRQGHQAKDKNCPALNQTCRKCSKTGHFASQCRTKLATAKPKQHTPAERPGKGKRQVNVVENKDAEDEDFAFMIGDVDQAKGTVSIRVGGAELCGVLIDSGSTCNLIDRATWNENFGFNDA